MEKGLNILHLVLEQGRPEGIETAAAVGRYAEESRGQLRTEIWAPKEGAEAGGLVNRAREARVTHRGLAATLALRSHIIRAGIDVVHCHDARAALAAAFLKETGGMPAVLWSVYRTPREEAEGRPVRERLRRIFNWMVTRNIDAVSAPSAFARGVVISRGHFAAERVLQITYGVECGPKVVERGRGGFGVLLLPIECGESSRRSAYHYFLRAGQAAARRVGGIFFVVVCGEGDMGQVESAARGHGILERVVIRSEASFPEVLGECDVAVLASGEIEGIRPLLTGMAWGKAVVAPNVRGPREFVETGSTGLLVKPGDAQALGEALERLGTSESLLRSLERKGREEAGRRFSSRRMAEELLGVYGRLAGHHGT